MLNLTPEQSKDCQDRIDKANAEIQAICEKYQVEPVVQATFFMGDTKYKSVPSPLTPNEPAKEA